MCYELTLCICTIAGIVPLGNDSLFTYRENTSFDEFHDPSFSPTFAPIFANVQLESEAEVICGSDPACLFDVATTGSVDIGLSTLTGSQDLQEIMELSVSGKCYSFSHSLLHIIDRLLRYINDMNNYSTSTYVLSYIILFLIIIGLFLQLSAILLVRTELVFPTILVHAVWDITAHSVTFLVSTALCCLQFVMH